MTDPSEARIIRNIKSSISALCCAGIYLTQAEGAWDSFRDWLSGLVGDDDLSHMIRATTADSMREAIRQADEVLMAAELASTEDEDFWPPWLDRGDEGSAA